MRGDESGFFFVVFQFLDFFSNFFFSFFEDDKKMIKKTVVSKRL